MAMELYPNYNGGMVLSDQTMSVLEGLPANRVAARIAKLLIVEVPVSNMQRAIKFYVGQLGFYLNVKKNPLPIASI